MNNKFFTIWFISIITLIPIVSANAIILPYFYWGYTSFMGLLLIFIIIIEPIIYKISFNKLFKIKISYWKSIGIIIIINLISTLFGILLVALLEYSHIKFKYLPIDIMDLLEGKIFILILFLAYLITILTEWIIIWYISLKFFKFKLTPKSYLIISFLINTFSYSLPFLLLILEETIGI